MTFSKDYDIKSQDSFFFDTNIWMYLFCPIANHRRQEQEKATKFYNRLLDRESYIIINSLVLSEFANTYLRIDFDLWKREEKFLEANFKRDFFSSERGKQTREIISVTIDKILKTCNKIPDSFNSISISRILETYKGVDFNDSYIAHQCIGNNWLLVTNDRDFNSINHLKIINL